MADELMAVKSVVEESRTINEYPSGPEITKGTVTQDDSSEFKEIAYSMRPVAQMQNVAVRQIMEQKTPLERRTLSKYVTITYDF